MIIVAFNWQRIELTEYVLLQTDSIIQPSNSNGDANTKRMQKMK